MWGIISIWKTERSLCNSQLFSKRYFLSILVTNIFFIYTLLLMNIFTVFWRNIMRSKDFSFCMMRLFPSTQKNTLECKYEFWKNTDFYEIHLDLFFDTISHYFYSTLNNNILLHITLFFTIYHTFFTTYHTFFGIEFWLQLYIHTVRSVHSFVSRSHQLLIFLFFH